jgi:hypothetical protein
MTLERYDIADVDKTREALEFKSPMEQVMAKLQTMSENKAVPKDVFLELQKIIGLLGKSSDVFKVQVSEALADKKIRLDDETTRYLFDLVNDHNYEHDVPVAGAGAGSGSVGGSAPSTAGGNGNSGVASPSGDSGPTTSTNSPTDPPLGLEGGSAGPPHREESRGGTGDPSSAHHHANNNNPVNGSPLQPPASPLLGSPPSSTHSLLPASVATSIQPKEERAIADLLKGMDSYNFDVFDVANLTGGKPLFFVGTALFKKYNLLNKFHIDRQKLGSFLQSVESGYLKTNPYHNSIHASDVARTVHYFLHNSMRKYTTDLEILALITASLIHDFVSGGSGGKEGEWGEQQWGNVKGKQPYLCSLAFFPLSFSLSLSVRITPAKTTSFSSPPATRRPSCTTIAPCWRTTMPHKASSSWPGTGGRTTSFPTFLRKTTPKCAS